MKTLQLDDTLIVLDNITRVTYEENDATITADNTCLIYFVGRGNDPFVIRGDQAKPAFDKIAQELAES